MTTRGPTFLVGNPFDNPIDSGNLDRRIIEQIVTERVERMVQTDGIQNYRIVSLGANRYTASESPNTYPYGMTNMALSAALAADGWPLSDSGGTATGWVETKKLASGTASRIIQTAYPKEWNRGAGASNYTWQRSARADTADGWSPWGLIAPVMHSIGTGTSYPIAVVDTWENVTNMSLTIDVPDYDNCDYEVSIFAWGSAFADNATAAANHLMRLVVNTTGSDVNGRASRNDADAANKRRPMAAQLASKGVNATGGDIIVHMEAQSSHADTVFDEFDMTVLVGAFQEN